MGALIEILDVWYAEPGLAGLWRGHIDNPSAGSTIEAGAAFVEGWIVGEGGRIVAVELESGGRVIARGPVGADRPDVTAAFAEVRKIERPGYRIAVDLVGRDRKVDILVSAVMEQRQRIHFATLRGRRFWRQSRGPERDLVSVVIPSHEKAHYLPDAIESVLAQTYPYVEIVVVDDGSHDNAAAVAARYGSVRYVRQANQGPAAARNTGIRHSNGDYLVFLDADDRLTPSALATGVRQLANSPEAAFAAGLYSYIDREGRPLPTPEQREVTEDPYAALLRTNVAGQPAGIMFRRSVFEHVRGFDPSPEVIGSEDYELFLRIAREFPVVFHREVVADYRQHGGNLSGSTAMMREHVLRVHRAQRPYLSSRQLKDAYAEGRAFWQSYYAAAPSVGGLRRIVRAAVRRLRAAGPSLT